MAKDSEKITNLPVPNETKDRVEAYAKADRRSYRAELLVLIEEALDARDRKQARQG